MEGANSHKCLSRDYLFKVATPRGGSYTPKISTPVPTKMAATLRSSGITRGKSSAEIVGLVTQHTWEIYELNGEIPTACRRKRLLLQSLQEVHEKEGVM